MNEVWSMVTSPQRFVECLPEVKDFKQIDKDNFEASVNAGIPLMKSRFHFAFKITSSFPTAQIQGRGDGAGSSIFLTLHAELASLAETKTRVAWHAETKFTGPLAGVGRRILQSITDDYVTRIVSCIRGAYV